MRRKIETEGFYSVRDLPNREFFKLKPESKRVYIRGEFDRSTRKYDCQSFDDISVSRQFDGKKKVYAGFTF